MLEGEADITLIPKGNDLLRQIEASSSAKVQAAT
jgi:hypothetical protein